MNFNFLCKDCYLDNSATSRYKPRCVINAVKRELLRSANAGRGGNKESIRASMLLESIRDVIRKYTGMPNVIFTKNCTEALNLAIFGICKSGMVITSTHEHNSVLRPLYYLRDKGIIKLKIIDTKNGELSTDKLSNFVTTDTKCVVLSEMTNVTGAIRPITQMATFLRARHINFIVDGAQSAGHIASDYQNVTAFCSSGHKGFHGPQGTGFLATNHHCPTLTPLILGGTGADAESIIQPRAIPEGYESGTVNVPSLAGLKEGIIWTMERMQELKAESEILNYTLLMELRKMPYVTIYSSIANGILTFNYNGVSCSEISDILSERNIYVRSGLHCAPLAHKSLGTLETGGTVRVSFGYGNKERDVYKLIDCLKWLNTSRH